MNTLPHGFRALVIGASGAIGGAFATLLAADARCGAVQTLSRGSQPALDLEREESVAAAAAALQELGLFQLIVLATGMLHAEGVAPEKRLAAIELASMETVFRTNTFGPALVLRYFTPLLDRQCGVMALLSARVGSIGDNRLGGWYSYRASKAALNMLVRSAAIELSRTHPGAVLAALHPGTVNSPLSRPFRGEQLGREPTQAAADMLDALSRLGPADSGSFIAYDGTVLPW